ncbi:hypothetical protein LTR37_007806 [Vermiconidia calcicola]|uniref:Uncharacterized protein n=1 Tax=Vermiconidia calcicola TaxID=1690605 RepID=A0ACC3NCZ4_9PEZI|nr:hypothetical protein LTR37_007806 [Vermiconidia calcicola]
MPGNPRRNNGPRNHSSNGSSDNNNGDAMNVDSYNGAPGSGIQCHGCGQQGHRKRECPNNNTFQQGRQNGQGSNRSNQSSQANNGRQHNSQDRPRCDFCNKDGHTNDGCFRNPNSPKYRGGNANNNQTIPNQANSNNGSGQQRNQASVNGFATKGYIFKDRIPQYSGSEPYCLICNENDHFEHQCTNPQRTQRQEAVLKGSLCCWRCMYRGHTADDCRHPEGQVCYLCHGKGHNEKNCRAQFEQKLHLGLHNVDKRFQWDGGYIPSTESAEQKVRDECEQRKQQAASLGQTIDAEEADQWNTALLKAQSYDQSAQNNADHPMSDVVPANQVFVAPTQPTRTTVARQRGASICQSTKHYKYTPTIKYPQPIQVGDISPELLTVLLRKHTAEQMSARERALRDKIDESAKRYRKQNYNLALLHLEPAIHEHHVLSEGTYFLLKQKMAQGYQFWRDPKAMEALVLGQKPLCRGCCGEGEILDRHMRSDVKEKDPLAVEDFEDWGFKIRNTGLW